jgi:mannose-1-phosphate guanylyltransferase/phosphomannomutase
LQDAPGSTIAIPFNLPNTFEKIAQKYNGRVMRTEIDREDLIRSACEKNIIMASDGRGNFIFPDFQCTADGLMALAKLLEFLATQQASLSDVVDRIPPYYVAERKVSCVWEAKARVMRLINEKFDRDKDAAFHSGVRLVFNEDEWALLVPDPDQPCFRITTEAESQKKAEQLADRYAQIVEKISPFE